MYKLDTKKKECKKKKEYKKVVRTSTGQKRKDKVNKGKKEPKKTKNSVAVGL